MSKIAKSTLAFIVTLAVLWAVGLLVFMARIQEKPVSASGLSADGIVALTGGGGRIQKALDVLAAGGGQRLLISGVNPSISSETILRAIGTSPSLADCCIDLGRVANDTRGNAAEAAAWAAVHDFKTLIIVTADYHMPRAQAEFQRALPNVKLVPLSVTTNANFGAISLEYSKFLISLSRLHQSNPRSESVV